MTRGGFAKFHRSIFDWEWYTDHITFHLFFHLILKANHEAKEWQGITIERGQCVSSIAKLSEELRCSPKQIRTAIKHLENSQNLASKGASKYTLFTINNYDKYQAKEEEQEPEEVDEGASKRANKGQTKGKQRATNKNYKNPRSNEEGIIPTPISPSEKSDKKQYAPHVSMTDEEYRKLCEKVSPSGAIRCVEILDAYKEASGKKYQSDYGAMRNWVINRYYEELDKGPPGLRRQQAPAREQETQQERNSRALREARERAEKEEMASGSQQSPGYRDIRTDQRQLPD